MSHEPFPSAAAVPRSEGYAKFVSSHGPELKEAARQLDGYIGNAIHAREGHIPGIAKPGDNIPANTSTRSAALRNVSEAVDRYHTRWFPIYGDPEKGERNLQPSRERSLGRLGLRTDGAYRRYDDRAQAKSKPEEQGQYILNKHLAEGLWRVAAVRNADLHAIPWTPDPNALHPEALQNKDWSAELHPRNIKAFRKLILEMAGQEKGGKVDKDLRSSGLGAVVDLGLNADVFAAYFDMSPQGWKAYVSGSTELRKYRTLPDTFNFIQPAPADILDTFDYMIALDDEILDMMILNDPSNKKADLSPFERIAAITPPPPPPPMPPLKPGTRPLKRARLPIDELPRIAEGEKPWYGPGHRRYQPPAAPTPEEDPADTEAPDSTAEPAPETEPAPEQTATPDAEQASTREDIDRFWLSQINWGTDIPHLYRQAVRRIQDMTAEGESLSSAERDDIITGTIDSYLQALLLRGGDLPMDTIARMRLTERIRNVLYDHDRIVRGEPAAEPNPPSAPAGEFVDGHVVDLANDTTPASAAGPTEQTGGAAPPQRGTLALGAAPIPSAANETGPEVVPPVVNTDDAAAQATTEPPSDTPRPGAGDAYTERDFREDYRPNLDDPKRLRPLAQQVLTPDSLIRAVWAERRRLGVTHDMPRTLADITLQERNAVVRGLVRNFLQTEYRMPSYAISNGLINDVIDTINSSFPEFEQDPEI